MQRKFFLSTLVVLLSIQSEYQIEARGFNGGKDSTNAKDLKEIENKLHEGLKAIKTTEVCFLKKILEFFLHNSKNIYEL